MKKITKRFLLFFALPLFSIAFILALWAFWLEPSSLTSAKNSISLEKWPKECDGLKVVVLADLHIGSPFYGLEKLDEVITATNKLQPDLVLLAGDFVIQGVIGGKFVEPADTAQRLKGLKAKLGVFAVLGNHDWWHGLEIMTKAFNDANIPLLEDTSIQLTNGSCNFTLVGISDYWEGAHDINKAFSKVDQEATVLAFTHNPDVFYELPQQIAITFAGHTHGGQVNLPFIGRPIVPSKYGEKLAIGHIVDQDRHLFVSSGLGTSMLPVRFRVAPEVSFIQLKSKK